MALAYLLSPTFQFVNTAGRPLTGGYLEVYIAGSRDKYYCASDFNGTLHPFRIPLDSLGASVVLADDGRSYDVYAYNRYGSLSMSRYNVSPGGGGISSGAITSTDGSIVITQTQGGVDLRVNLEAPTVMRCSAEDLTSDGSFQFTQVQRDGQGARVVSRNVNIDKGWWHYDATVRIRWQGAAESTQQVGLYSSNGSDTMDFDLSYPHSETVRLSGEYKAAENGTTFTIGFTGIVAGMTASLVDFGIHTVTNGSGAGGQYYAGDGIEVNESDRIISAKVDGTTIDTNADGELEVIGSRDIYVVTYESGGTHPASLFDDAYAAYQAGKTLVLNWASADWKGSCIGYYSAYGLMFSVETVNLSGNDATDGSIQYLWLYKHGTQSRWRSSNLKLLPRSSADDAGKVLMVNPEHPLGTPVWTSLPNFSDFVTDTELSTILEGYQTALSAGANIQIDNGTISATDTTYSAGTGLNLSGTEFSADTTVLATKSDIPATKDLVAGSNINITEGSTTVTISATAAPQLQANWAESSPSSVQYIQNKPTIPVLPDTKDLVAGANVTITEGADSVTIAATDTTYTAGTNVQINGTTISATDTTYSAGNGLTLSGTEFAIDTTVVATKSDLPEDEIFYVDTANSDYDTALAAYNAGKTLVLKGDCYTGYLCRYTPMDGLVFAYNLPWTVDGVATATQVGYMAMRKVTDTGETYWHGFSSCAIPKATREDSGKVLTVSGSNTATWTSLPDLTPYVTDTELSTILQGYQEALTAGSNIQISNGVISATDTTYTAGDGLALNGTEFSVSVGPNLYIDPNTHKLGAVDTLPVAGYGLSNSGYNILDVDTSVIQTKLTAGSNIQINNGTISVTVDQTYDATSTNPQSGTAVAEAVAGVDTSLFQAEYGVTPFADIAAAITAKKAVYCKVSPLQNSSRMAFLAYYKLAGNNTDHIEFQYYRSNGDADGADSVFVYDVTRKDVWTTVERTPQKAADWNAESGTFNSIAHKPDLSVYATTSAMNTALAAKQDTLTAGTNVTISAQNEISAVDTTYTAGSGLDLTGTEFSVDTSVVATQADLADYTPTASLGAVALSNDYEDLSNLPTVKPMVAGNNISIAEGASDITIACNITIGTVTV